MKVFKRVRQYNMRLNPEKCTFRARAEKYLGFCLTNRGIEPNPDKCEEVVQINVLPSKKDVQKLNDILTALNMVISKSSHYALPFYRMLRKEATFEWTHEYER